MQGNKPTKLCRYCGEPGVGYEDDFHEKCADLYLERQMKPLDKTDYHPAPGVWTLPDPVNQYPEVGDSRL